MKFKKGDIIVVIILAVAVISWFGINKIYEAKSDRRVVIETGGTLYETVPLKAGMEQKKIHIELENDRHIDIVIDENGAYVEDVLCPDKIIQKTGVKKTAGESIVCLPNKVVIYIEGEEETKTEVDGVSS